MYRYLLFLFVFLLLNSILSAQNHMDIMTTMTGEHNWALMGDHMTTLDWNGDGYDDLIINQNGWRPPEYIGNTNVRSYGKLGIYFGGPNFDNIPEITMPGSYQQEFLYTNSMCNAGDMNGDGIDELALFRATMYENNNNQNYDLQLCVYYGGANPDTIPDYVLTFPREVWDNGYCYVRGLGDINHDGFDDIGYTLREETGNRSYSFNIIYGESVGTLLNSQFMTAGSVSGVPNLVGVGDINADGIDDFTIGYMYILDGTWYRKTTLYYGNSIAEYTDSLAICNGSNIISTFSYPAGDVNGDGYDDFVSSFSYANAKLYFGGPGFTATQFTNFSPPYNGSTFGEGFAFGDVNGDGRDDLMGSFASQSNGNGVACLWMSEAPVNGDPDLYIPPPLPPFVDSQMFGFCLTMGDYNGDGFCDAAISAPFDYSGTGIPGRVFVYAGNPLLVDPIDDETAPVIIKTLKLYPNPLQPSNSVLNVKFNTRLTPDPSLARKRGEINPLSPSGREGNSTFDIYNIRGQKVKSFAISAEQAKSGSALFNLNDLSSGVYVCVFTNGEMQHKGKLTIIK